MSHPGFCSTHRYFFSLLTTASLSPLIYGFALVVITHVKSGLETLTTPLPKKSGERGSVLGGYLGAGGGRGAAGEGEGERRKSQPWSVFRVKDLDPFP